MSDTHKYISDIITTCMKLTHTKGEAIQSIPFIIPSDGFVYDDQIMRVACSTDGAFIEVYRKASESIVFDLGNAVLRKYSPEMDLLIPHTQLILTQD